MMGFGKRKKVEEVDSSVASVDVGEAQPPPPPPKAPEVVVDPETEGLVKEVYSRFGGLYGAQVSPGTVLAAESATLLVAVLAELRRVNDNLELLLVEVRKS